MLEESRFIDPVKYREAMPHQLDAIEYGLSTQHPALLMQMRLGKTLCAIRILNGRFPGRAAILVVAPPDVLNSWKRELALEGKQYFEAYGIPSTQRDMIITAVASHGLNRHIYVLTNYETFRICPHLADYHWNSVILDESTKIKNPKAQVSQVAGSRFTNVDHRMLLTGLAAPESAMDLHNQFKYAKRHFMGVNNFYNWRAKYYEQEEETYYYDLEGNRVDLDPDPTGEWMPKSGTLMKVNDWLHKNAFVLKRSDVNLGSEKVYERREIELDPAEYKELRRVEKEFAVDAVDMSTMWSIVVETWLGRMTGGWYPSEHKKANEVFHSKKITALVDLLTGELSEEQVVVWFRFNVELEVAARILRERGVQLETIYGGVSVGERDKAVARFQSGASRVTLNQIQCAKYSLDYSMADTAIYYSNIYSCEARAQSEDRIISPLQTSPKLIMDLVVKDSIDERVVDVLADKMASADWLMTNIRAYIEEARNRK